MDFCFMTIVIKHDVLKQDVIKWNNKNNKK